MKFEIADEEMVNEDFSCGDQLVFELLNDAAHARNPTQLPVILNLNNLSRYYAPAACCSYDKLQ